MTLKGVNHNVDFSCAGLPDTTPSSILAGPVTSIHLEKLHKQQHTLPSHSTKKPPHAQQRPQNSPRSQRTLYRGIEVPTVSTPTIQNKLCQGPSPNQGSNRPGQSRAGQGGAGDHTYQPDNNMSADCGLIASECDQTAVRQCLGLGL